MVAFALPGIPDQVDQLDIVPDTRFQEKEQVQAVPGAKKIVIL